MYLAPQVPKNGHPYYVLIGVLHLLAILGGLIFLVDKPILLATAFLAYLLGLRHAIDPDHLSAIDNVTRQLIYANRNPSGVGFYFSLGHSTVIFLLCLGIGLFANDFSEKTITRLQDGAFFGASISGVFLLVVSMGNFFILKSAIDKLKNRKNDSNPAIDQADLPGKGFFSQNLRKFLTIISKSWQMYPMGFLFGLGFETASEVALLGIASIESAANSSIWLIMLFPLLFCSGMTLIDTINSSLMIKAYQWSNDNPKRKIYYNIAITSLSIFFAIAIGSVEIISTLNEKFHFEGLVFECTDWVTDHFTAIGLFILVCLFLVWLLSYVLINNPKLKKTI